VKCLNTWAIRLYLCPRGCVQSQSKTNRQNTESLPQVLTSPKCCPRKPTSQPATNKNKTVETDFSNDKIIESRSRKRVSTSTTNQQPPTTNQANRKQAKHRRSHCCRRQSLLLHPRSTQLCSPVRAQAQIRLNYVTRTHRLVPCVTLVFPQSFGTTCQPLIPKPISVPFSLFTLQHYCTSKHFMPIDT
jgi:hypothetical protein